MGKSDKPSDPENGTRKWCSYHYSNRHSNEDCYQQQQSGGRWCTYHKSETHMDDQCYHQRHGSRSSSADGKKTKYETFAADSNMTSCEKCGCNGKAESKTTEDDEPNNTPPGVGFSFAMCHSPLSQEADGFQLLVDSGSLKYFYFIDPALIPGVESRMQEYTRIEPPIKITAAGNNVLRGAAQGILLVVVRGTDDGVRTVQLPVVLVPGLKRNLFSSSAAAKKGVRTIIEQKGSSLDLGAFNVQLTRSSSMEYLDLTIANESRRTESALCAISGKTFRKEAVLTALVPMKSVAQPVAGSIKQSIMPIEDRLCDRG